MSDKERRLMMAVATDDENNYYVDLGKGSNVAETAFCTMCVIKCLVRDGVIESVKEFTDMLNKYLTDPQFDEVKDVNDNSTNINAD